MIAGGPGVDGVCPSFGIVMKAEHEVRLDVVVDEGGASSDF